MARAATLLLLAVLLLWVLAWAFQRRLIYFPFSHVPPAEQLGLRHVETVRFPTDDGLTLDGWFVRPSSASGGPTVIVFNGNAGNRAYRAPLAARLGERGMATFLFDYRGYGGNPGTPTERGLELDARGARRAVLSRAGTDAAPLVYFGESLGAAVALGLALEHPPRALVLRSPFTSLADVGAHHYPFLPVRWLLRDRFPSSDRIGRLRCPVLIITAEHDSIVPSEQSRRLYDAAPGPKRLLVLSNTDHNEEELLSGQRLVEAVVAFLGGR